jgi:hypothetical protein
MRNVFFLSAVAAGLVAMSGSALANNYVGGSSFNANCSLTSDSNWTTCRTVTINITDAGSHGCVVTSSADVSFPFGGMGLEGTEHIYRIVVTRNDSNPATNAGGEREVHLIDNPEVNDINSAPVATTSHFTGLTNDNGISGTGQHTFRLLGRRGGATSDPTDVLDAALSVICAHTP